MRLQIGKAEAEYRRKHSSSEHLKSDVETRGTGTNHSSESSSTSGSSKPSSSKPVNRFYGSRIDEKLDSNSEDSSQGSTDESSCASSTVAESESTWLEKSLQPDADVVKEERKIVRRRIRHKYSGLTVPQEQDQGGCADGEDSATIELREEGEESSS